MGLPSSCALHISEVSCDIVRACKRCEACVLERKGNNHHNVEHVYIHSRVTVLIHVTFTYTCASNERFVWCSQICSDHVQQCTNTAGLIFVESANYRRRVRAGDRPFWECFHNQLGSLLPEFV